MVAVPTVVACWIPLLSLGGHDLPGVECTRTLLSVHSPVPDPWQAPPTSAHGVSRSASLSADGRLVAFASWARDLTDPPQPASDTATDVFVLDIDAGTVEALTQAGGPPDGDSELPSLSAGGRFVAFESDATTLIAGDTNGVRDVYLADRTAGTIVRVSLADGSGAEANGRSSGATVSNDGRRVAFLSEADDLVPGDTNGQRDVFVRDLAAQRTWRLSVAADGTQADWRVRDAQLSADGETLVFSTRATHLVPDDTEQVPAYFDVFLVDLTELPAARPTLVSRAHHGGPPDGHSFAASVDATGARVAFMSGAPDMLAGTPRPFLDVYVWTRATGTVRRLGQGFPTEPFGDSFEPRLSRSGRFVAFQSRAPNWTERDTTGEDVYLYDLLTDVVRHVSLKNPPGSDERDAHTDQTMGPLVSDDGTRVVFHSDSGQIGWFPDTNNRSDVFLYECTLPEFPSSCDGREPNEADCPCGNRGAQGHGCASSRVAEGARLAATGFPQRSDDRLILTASGLPTTTTALLMQAAGPHDAPTRFGDGLLCTTTSVAHVAGVLVDGGTARFGYGSTSVPSLGGAVVGPGVSIPVTYQLVYRNQTPGFCTEARLNTSNAVEVVWWP